jgi:dTDP-glucose 4,6-dehydratase
MKILITGGCGFIGHHFVDYILEKTNWDIVILDRLDISGNLNRLIELDNWEREKRRVKFVFHDLKATINEFVSRDIGDVNYIVHFAGSTHVDRSLINPMEFVLDNVVGTTNLLEFAKTLKNLKLMVNFSTDEVFGPAPDNYAHKENEAHRPSNPYSASKASAVDMTYSYFISYGLPVINTFTMNNFGERQHPEKLIPKTIRSILEQKPMPIYAKIDPKGKIEAAGTRFWLHCRNTSSAILVLLVKGKAGEFYNIIGFDELSNYEIAQKIATIIGQPLIIDFVDFYKARPGHDRRYALDGTKLLDMGWRPEVDFEKSLEKTVNFTIMNSRWM